MNGQPPPLPAPSRDTFAHRNALALKLLVVGALVLLLLVPLHFVDNTLDERLVRHDAAVASIAQTWGKSQRLLGPILVVPYTYRTETDEWTTAPDGRRFREKVVHTHNAEAYFLPEQLDLTGDLEPSKRQRGIYETWVYAATLRLSGHFAAPDLAFTNIAGAELQRDKARVCFAITDLRGTREALALKWGEVRAPLQPGAGLEGFGPGLHAPVALAPTPGAGATEFSLELTLNGSESLTVVPVGRQTSVKLASPWTAPGFSGSFLPVRRNVGEKGFDATWQVSYYGRDFPQHWTNAAAATPPAVATIEASAFGVTLVQTMTAYRIVERAIKYGVLFLALVFVTFFLFEALGDLQLNLLNYLLVGLALCLFYLGLLSLSEFIGFTAAYVGAAGASVLLIGLYGWSVLRKAWRAALVAAMLTGVYGYLYFVLRMEDFALLAGTGALFAVLAAIMWATRRVERAAELAIPAMAAS
jgi:inner membrane protein